MGERLHRRVLGNRPLELRRMFPAPVPRQLREALPAPQRERRQRGEADAGDAGGQQERPGGAAGRLRGGWNDEEPGDRRLYGLLRHLRAREPGERPTDIHGALPELYASFVRTHL